MCTCAFSPTKRDRILFMTAPADLLTLKCANPDSKVHGANMGPTWVLSAPCTLLVGRHQWAHCWLNYTLASKTVVYRLITHWTYIPQPCYALCHQYDALQYGQQYGLEGLTGADEYRSKHLSQYHGCFMPSTLASTGHPQQWHFREIIQHANAIILFGKQAVCFQAFYPYLSYYR